VSKIHAATTQNTSGYDNLKRAPVSHRADHSPSRMAEVADPRKAVGESSITSAPVLAALCLALPQLQRNR